MAPSNQSLDSEHRIIAPRCGRIVVHGGLLRRIDRLYLPHRATISRVWFDTFIHRGGSSDTCTLHYSGTRSIPGFLALDYVRSGPRTTFQTARAALGVLDHIARLRQSVAIVAHVSTGAISDRLLRRYGWEVQATRMRGRHWIKRFYDGYPAHALARWLPLPE